MVGGGEGDFFFAFSTPPPIFPNVSRERRRIAYHTYELNAKVIRADENIFVLQI